MADEGSGDGALCGRVPPPGHVPLELGGEGARVTMVGGKDGEGLGIKPETEPRLEPELELEPDPELNPEAGLLANGPASCCTSE